MKNSLNTNIFVSTQSNKSYILFSRVGKGILFMKFSKYHFARNHDRIHHAEHISEKHSASQVADQSINLLAESGKGRNEKEEDEEKRVSRFPSSSHGTSGEESGMGIEGTEDGLCVPLDAESSVVGFLSC